MKTVKLNKKKTDYKMGCGPNNNHYQWVINSDAILVDGDEVIGIYIKIPKEELSVLRKVALNTKYAETYRTSALPTKSSVFGALPRNEVRNDYCRLTVKTVEELNNYKRLLKFQKYLCKIYKKYLPNDYKREVKWVKDNIDLDYGFKDIPYTSINVNVNHAIKYHRDRLNIKNSYSNIIIVKNNISGGELVLPDYGVALSQDDGFMAIIKGQEVAHGVMPIKQMSNTNYYRASFVYYTPEKLKECLPFKEELKRFQQSRVEKARNRRDKRGYIYGRAT